MPKCIGCKKDFKSQGFPAHKKSCKPFQREIKARLKNVPNFNPSDTEINPDNTEDVVADLEGLVTDEAQVCHDAHFLNFNFSI